LIKVTLTLLFCLFVLFTLVFINVLAFIHNQTVYDIINDKIDRK